MSVILLLIPLSIIIAASFLAGFIWAVRSGQYEDTCTPSMRLLTDDLAGAQVPPPLNGERDRVRGENGRALPIARGPTQSPSSTETGTPPAIHSH